jgi:hypothetical protein
MIRNNPQRADNEVDRRLIRDRGNAGHDRRKTVGHRRERIALHFGRRHGRAGERIGQVAGRGRARDDGRLRARSIAARAVASTHICVMNPTMMIAGRFNATTRSARSVLANALGRRLPTTGSPGAGAACGAIPAPLEPTANAPPALPRCTIWMIGVPAARARPSSRSISLSAGSTCGNANAPSTYSRCASITTSTASERRDGVGTMPAMSSRVFGGIGRSRSRYALDAMTCNTVWRSCLNNDTGEICPGVLTQNGYSKFGSGLNRFSASSLDSRTQNAPKRIAPTKANTAQITRTFSFKAMSTSLASHDVDQTKV